jgi:hypothetical protein
MAVLFAELMTLVRGLRRGTLVRLFTQVLSNFRKNLGRLLIAAAWHVGCPSPTLQCHPDRRSHYCVHAGNIVSASASVRLTVSQHPVYLYIVPRSIQSYIYIYTTSTGGALGLNPLSNLQINHDEMDFKDKDATPEKMRVPPPWPNSQLQ